MSFLNSITQRGLNAISSLRFFYSLPQLTASMSTLISPIVQNEETTFKAESSPPKQSCPINVQRTFKKNVSMRDLTDRDLLARLVSLFKESPQVSNLMPLLVMYHTEYDMSVWSYDSHSEREKIVNNFIQIALTVTASLKSAGYWCDFIDPTSGMPYHGSYCNETFTECDEDFHRLDDSLSLEDIGSCRALMHCDWGFNVFAGLLLTNAPKDVLIQAYTSANFSAA